MKQSNKITNGVFAEGRSLFADREVKTNFDILRAQLSDIDRRAVLRNCCHSVGGAMKALVAKHGLLKGMDFNSRKEYPEQMEMMAANAFGE